MQETRVDPWVGKIPWRRKWQPTPIFLPGEFHGQKSLSGYCPWSLKESDTAERLNTFPLHFQSDLINRTKSLRDSVRYEFISIIINVKPHPMYIYIQYIQYIYNIYTVYTIYMQYIQYICMYVYIHTYIYIYIVYIHIYMYTYIYTYICICTYIVCIYTCICICICIYTSYVYIVLWDSGLTKVLKIWIARHLKSFFHL